MPSTAFSLNYSTDRLLHKLKPFILTAHGLIARGASFDRAIGEALRVHPSAARYFVGTNDASFQSFSLRQDLLFNDWTLDSLQIQHDNSLIQIDLRETNKSERQSLHELVFNLATGSAEQSSFLSPPSPALSELLRHLICTGSVTNTQEPWRTKHTSFVEAPGITRLQHASLLFRSRLARIIVDPQFHTIYDIDIDPNVYRRQIAAVDAILISHCHTDHWSLPSLMMFPKNCLVIVPDVPHSSIICTDMKRLLRKMGFTNVISPQWNSSPIHIRDLRVHVLPFLGEQPLRFEEGKDPRLKNWGNTYIVETEDYTAWVLIDSGADVRGSMVDVAADVQKRIGPIDVVLSNLKRFSIVSPLYINGGLNWLTLSAPQMGRLPNMSSHSLTLGCDGVAQVCGMLRPSIFLPYAHWWGNLGACPQGEGTLIAKLKDSMDASGISTKIGEWSVGDSVSFNRLSGPVFDKYSQDIVPRDISAEN